MTPGSSRCVHTRFETHAAGTPERVAVVGDGLELSYGALDARANRLAHWLRAQGVAPEVPVAVCVERSAWLPIAMLAVFKAGGVWVPLDPDHPDARLHLLVHTTEARLVLVEGALAQRFAGLPRVSDLDALNLDPWPDQDLPAPPPTALAYVMHTSGSTGQPKGVLVEHSNLIARFPPSPYFRLREHDTLAAITAVSWNPSIFEVLYTLARGARIALADRAVSRDPLRLRRFLEAHDVTFLRAVPSLFRGLLDAGWQGRPDLTLITHGEALGAALADQLRQRGRVLYNTYGATEASVFSVVQVQGGRTTMPLGDGESRLLLLDAGGEPVAQGEVGEIHVAGPVVARGYLKDPAATAERFSNTPRGRLYRTGDLGRRGPDGQLIFLGRADDQIKLRGQRIEPGEVEAVLTACPGVRAAVVGLHGEAEHARLVAWVVGGEHLEAQLAAQLPPHLVPSALVHLAALPLNANGKVDRSALPAPAAPSDYSPPQDGTQAFLASLWTELLPVERVGLDDDFLSLGGHSLLATQIAVRVQAAFGVELSMQTFFGAPTVRALAAAIDAGQGIQAPHLPPLVPSSDQAGALSFAQERLWFLHRLAPEDPAYNLPTAVRLVGELDVQALSDALVDLQERHEPLRTRFLVDEHGRPFQQVEAPERVLHGVTHVGHGDSETTHVGHSETTHVGHGDSETTHVGHGAETTHVGHALRARVADLALQPFDLARQPPLRVALFEVAEHEHVLFLNTHHIASDGWSQALLRADLGRLYSARVQGRGRPAPLPSRYLDYARWQRDWLAAGELDRQLSWWRARLQDAPPLELLGDHPRPPRFSTRAGREVLRLPPALVTDLRALATAHGASLYMVLLAAFDALLFRYTGQTDLCVASPIAGRVRPETEDLVGFFVNTLVLRTLVEGDLPFADLLDRVKHTALGAFAHQDLPFERLVADLNPERDPSRHPLAQVVLALQNTPVGEAELAGLQVERFPIDSATTRFDAELHLWDEPAGLRCHLLYSRALFEPWRMQALLRHFAAVLRTVAAAPRTPVADLPLLDDDERERLARWNETAAPVPEGTLHALFAEQAQRTPGAHAVGDLDYRRLHDRATQLARHLTSLGVCAGDRVGIALDRGPELIVAMIGVVQAGAAYVPLDPDHPVDRLRWMAEDAGLARVVTLQPLAPRLGVDEALLVCLDRDADAIAIARAEPPKVDANALAYVLYTSGSTGRPKGVAVEHRSVVNLAASHAAAQAIGPSDRCSFIASPSFDASGLELWPALLAGASLHAPDDETRRLPARLLAWLGQHRITITFVATPLLELCLDLEWPDSLRFVNVGGSRLSRRPPAGLPFALVNHYGPTEATVVATNHLVEPGEGAPPIGRPIANTTAWVLDPAGRLCPIGVPGELCLGGLGLARGYLGQPERTAARFVQGPGGRVYRTGDRVSLDPDGALTFLGRFDDQVKLRGYRIETGEIDVALTRHPGVHQAVTVLRQDGPSERLVSYVVADRSDDDRLIATWTSQWQALYDREYARPAEDPTFDTSGWNSSFTGEPIPAAYMREWVDTTVAAIRELAPRRLLEIGCGTGLLLHALLPTVEHYTASDFSRSAVEGLRRLATERLTLHTAPAHDLAWLGEARFDTVVLNSVVQYFPSAGYLERLLASLLPRVEPGGHLFLGDIRDLDQLLAFHREVARARAEQPLSPSEVERRAQDQALRDKELLLSRRWLLALPARFPCIDVHILEKRGAAPTEMNRYRYDVVLTVAGGGQDGPSPPSTLASDPLLTLRADALRPALQAHLAAWLPEYMLPSAVVFLPSLPMSASGKIHRAALPPPVAERPQDHPFEAPVTEVERVVAALFAAALQVEAVGLHDNFFALGGHSLLAVQVVSQVHERLGVDVPLSTLFAEPTVKAVAQWVEGAEITAPDALDSHADADVVPLTATDLSFHYGKQFLQADARAWYQVLEVRTGRLDLDRLRAAVLYTVNRHPLLRGYLSRTDTFGREVFWDARHRVAEAPLDLAHAEHDAARDRLRERLVATPLPIGRPPSCRFTLVRSPGEDTLLLRYNHGAVDASGLLCLLDSLFSRYLGRPDPVRRLLPFTTAELLAYYGRSPTPALKNNEIAHLTSVLPNRLAPSPRWLAPNLRSLASLRAAQLHGSGGTPGDRDAAAIERAFTPEQTRRLDAAARARQCPLDRLFLVGILTGAAEWNQQYGDYGRLEAYWAVNLRPPRYLRSVVANQFAWSRVRTPSRDQWPVWRREMFDPGADFLLRGALDWIQALEAFDSWPMPDLVRRRVLRAVRGINPSLFVSNIATVADLDDGPLATAMGVRSTQLYSAFVATDKPLFVLRRRSDRLEIRLVYPRSLFDEAGADRFLGRCMDTVRRCAL